MNLENVSIVHVSHRPGDHRENRPPRTHDPCAALVLGGAKPRAVQRALSAAERVGSTEIGFASCPWAVGTAVSFMLSNIIQSAPDKLEERMSPRRHKQRPALGCVRVRGGEPLVRALLRRFFRDQRQTVAEHERDPLLCEARHYWWSRETILIGTDALS